MDSYDLTITFTRELLLRANRYFLVRSFGFRGTVSLLAVVLLFVYLLVSGERDWLFGASAAGVFFVIVLIVMVFRVRQEYAVKRFEMMKDKSAHLRFGSDMVEMTSDLGRSEVPWNQFVQLWRQPDFWLLFYDRNAFVTLPAAQLEPELRDFIVEKVRQNGGKTD